MNESFITNTASVLKLISQNDWQTDNIYIHLT